MEGEFHEATLVTRAVMGLPRQAILLTDVFEGLYRRGLAIVLTLGNIRCLFGWGLCRGLLDGVRRGLTAAHGRQDTQGKDTDEGLQLRLSSNRALQARLSQVPEPGKSSIAVPKPGVGRSADAAS